MDLAWTTQAPTLPGLYWRRDGRKAPPYLVLILGGTQGLIVRIVDASHSWNDRKPNDRPLEWLDYGQWAGPLGLHRDEPLKPVDMSHIQQEVKMEEKTPSQ